MNLEEVEKSITKDINLLKEGTDRLNDDWKILRPIERILLVHTCFNELGIINREILDFGNTCLSEFPPVPNYLNDNWKKGIKRALQILSVDCPRKTVSQISSCNGTGTLSVSV